MTYFIDLRADSSGGNPVGGIDDIVVRTDQNPNPNPSQSLEPDLQNAVQGRDVLLATHGFHVNRAAGIARLTEWSSWVTLGQNGYFVAVLWPGDSRWLPFLDYPFEGDEAIKSGQLLARYLAAKFDGVNSLSFCSHSLGARTMLECIRALQQSGNFELRTITMMAAAIDDTCLTQEYSGSAAAMKKIAVLASRSDDVLKWAFPAGNPVAGLVTRGEPYWHGALGRYGPNPPGQPVNLFATPILPDNWKFGHDSYINCLPPTEASRFQPPVVVPDDSAALPINPPPIPANWQQQWAAAFVSTEI